jgi:predicted O-methyltransferase YrrM
MNERKWSDVDGYFSELLVGPDRTLAATLEASEAAGLPPINVAENQGKFLMLLAVARGACNILEIGTLGGYSTIWLARALPPEGRLVTLEAVPTHARVARENIKRAGFGEGTRGPAIEVRLGRALDTLPQLEAEGRGPFDFVFIDANKSNYPEYFHWSLKLARVGTVIIADNVVRDGEVINGHSRDANVIGVRRFLELVSLEPRVSATAIQTVGCKGYDGFAMAVVTS